jgi:flagellar FliL protein
MMERALKMPEEDQKQVQGKTGSSKLLIILIVLVVVLGGAGAGVYLKFFRASSETGEPKKEEASPVYYEMDTFMVNLADAGGKRFLKVTVRLRVESTHVMEECKLRGFEMRDLVLMLLTSKESEEINKPEDKLVLKKQILDTINRALKKGQALDVYFTEFLIQ